MRAPTLVVKSQTQIVEFFYAVVLIFSLTQGPVLRLWRSAELYTSVPITPTIQATFFVVQLPALLILARRGIARHHFKSPLVLLFGLVLWMMVSTFWTNLSRYSIVEATSFGVSTFVGLYIAQSFSVKKQILTVFCSMQLGVMYSYIAVRLKWPETISADGNWVGVYFNRNSLAPVAMIGFASSVFVFYLAATKMNSYLRLPALTTIAMFGLIDLAIYSKTNSAMSMGAITAFGLAWSFWTLVRKAKEKRHVSIADVQKRVYPMFIGAALFFTWVGFRYQHFIIGWFGKADFFNGRSALWHFSWTGVLERPVLGWGWRAAWSTPEFLKRDLWWTTSGAQFSHNGFLEVLLGGGFIAGLMFLVFVVWSGWVRVGSVCEEELGQWSFALATFILVANSQEVFITGNHFLWVLLVASLSRVKPAPVQSAETSSTPST
jgi:O-antigen ligase